MFHLIEYGGSNTLELPRVDHEKQHISCLNHWNTHTWNPELSSKKFDYPEAVMFIGRLRQPYWEEAQPSGEVKL